MFAGIEARNAGDEGLDPTRLSPKTEALEVSALEKIPTRATQKLPTQRV
jgi:hypothetical protein